jgi:hypothetical protein
MTRKETKTSAAMLADKERETSLNTHRLQCMVSHNTILSANEYLEFSTLIILFFCSFTDKILNCYIFKSG